MYKNNQIISTKCQYNDTVSKFKWSIFEKWFLFNRKKTGY